MVTPFSWRRLRPHTAAVESEAMRLERAADLFTARLEHERRQGLLLTEQIRIHEEELRKRKEQAKHAGTSNNPEERRLRLQIAGLEHQIHLISANLADTQTINSGLKGRIDSYRREQTNYRQAIQSLFIDLNDVQKTKGERSNERLKLLNADVLQRKQLDKLRSKSAHQQFRHQVRVQELEVTLTQAVIKEDLTFRDNFFKSIEDNFKVQMHRALETLDPTSVQQALLKKWKDVMTPQKVYEAKRDFDNYMKHVKVVEDAFQSIKEATGISETGEAVTSIIKTQEQQSSLYSHMNDLMSEIDSLEELLTNVKALILRKHQAKEQGEHQAIDIKEDLKVQVGVIQSQLAGKQDHLSKVKNDLVQVFSAIKTAVELFSANEFQDIMVTQMHREDIVSGETVMSYLAEVDAGINTLLTWLAYIRGQGRSISSLPTKIFSQTPRSIRGLAAGLEDDLDEDRVPLREEEIRSKVKILLEQKFHQSYSTLASTVNRVDLKRRTVTPH